MENRRKSLRSPMATIAHITPHGLQGTSDVMVKDLSTEGMGCYSDHVYREGDMILTKIKLDLPGPGTGVIQASLMGRVMWVKPANEEKKYAIGVEFRELEKSNPTLYKHLKDLEEHAQVN